MENGEFRSRGGRFRSRLAAYSAIGCVFLGVFLVSIASFSSGVVSQEGSGAWTSAIDLASEAVRPWAGVVAVAMLVTGGVLWRFVSSHWLAMALLGAGGASFIVFLLMTSHSSTIDSSQGEVSRERASSHFIEEAAISGAVTFGFVALGVLAGNRLKRQR